MKFWIILVLTILLIGGAATGTYFIWRSTGYLTTDNARVTTNFFDVIPQVPGVLERFTIYEGRYVAVNEVLGWVEGGEPMRSPFDGLVVYSGARQGQAVSHMSNLAVIADINNIHIEANIEETDIGRIHRGQRVYVTIDPFGNEQFEGFISEIGRVTSAELAGQSMFFNTGGTFTRVTHLIPVEITLVDDVDLNNFIGVNARVRIPLRTESTQAFSSLAGNISSVRGIVESVESRNVYSASVENVERIYVEVGEKVTAGQVLATLETENLSLMIAQQKIELESLRQMVEIIPPQRRTELETLRQLATLTPRQQQAELDVIRQSNENMVQQSRRMYEEAVTNLENNTNIHIISAEAALTAAELHLSSIRREYDTARTRFSEGNNPLIAGAESALTSIELELETAISNHERFERLYEAGGISRNDLRQSETALTHLQNAFDDASENLENARETERLTLEQLENALYAAVSTHRDAITMLDTTRIAAQHELEMLRGNLSTAEIAANLEPMEIAVNMAAMEIASNLTAMENAIQLEITELTAALERTEIALELMERQLEDSILNAPISGTVTAVIAREGAAGAGLMFIIEDTENLRITTRIREHDIALVEAGMGVKIIADATGATPHEGVISRVSPAADIHSPIVEFEVEIAILSQETGLRIGMNARIELGDLR
ncbi:MAG: HlyD family efflux transporter periplasmic adaptor subunit [Defluviitaleaceae bacterium]|nr:HlyD family efflux transporter periplasmic adaptor subunit [Defluviitaleaceae bacterium]